MILVVGYTMSAFPRYCFSAPHPYLGVVSKWQVCRQSKELNLTQFICFVFQTASPLPLCLALSLVQASPLVYPNTTKEQAPAPSRHVGVWNKVQILEG